MPLSLQPHSPRLSPPHTTMSTNKSRRVFLCHCRKGGAGWLSLPLRGPLDSPGRWLYLLQPLSTRLESKEVRHAPACPIGPPKDLQMSGSEAKRAEVCRCGVTERGVVWSQGVWESGRDVGCAGAGEALAGSAGPGQGGRCGSLPVRQVVCSPTPPLPLPLPTPGKCGLNGHM